jgi:hypothetical protein
LCHLSIARTGEFVQISRSEWPESGWFLDHYHAGAHHPAEATTRISLRIGKAVSCLSDANFGFASFGFESQQSEHSGGFTCGAFSSTNELLDQLKKKQLRKFNGSRICKV